MKALGILIGGLDPSGGAGVTADIATLHAFGHFQVVSIVSALTAQNPDRFWRSVSTEQSLFRDQLKAILAYSRGFARFVIKIGMIPELEQWHAIGDFVRDLKRQGPLQVVCDPVMASTANAHPLGIQESELWFSQILPLCDVWTPNQDELQQVLGVRSGLDGSLQDALAGVPHVIVKGGHSSDAVWCEDRYEGIEGSLSLFQPREKSVAHGSGCVFATAIAAGLLDGLSVRESMIRAKAYINGTSLNRKAPCHQVWPFFTSIPTVVKGWALENGPFASMGGVIGAYPIVDDPKWIAPFARAGVTTIQLRVKSKSGAELDQLIYEAVRASEEQRVRLFINDYWEQAIAFGAYGVHLGQEDIQCADLGAIQKAGLRLGLSTHSYEELAIAMSYYPSYVALGPIRPTKSKPMRFGPQGFARVQEWLSMIGDTPLVAIGGLSLNDAAPLRDMGVSGVSVISDIMAAQDPAERALAWVLQMQLPRDQIGS